MKVEWQEIGSAPKSGRDVHPERLSRAAIPGGWLVYSWDGAAGSPTITFVPDPEHIWGLHEESGL